MHRSLGGEGAPDLGRDQVRLGRRERRGRRDTRLVDYNDASITENTRAAYPLEFIPGFVPEGRGGHADTIVFLTADAFGVLPPISRLSPEAAMYHFLSGFTAKLAGTEAGVGSEPEATFSTCFGAPFLPLEAEHLRGDARRAHRRAPFERLFRQHRLDREAPSGWAVAWTSITRDAW